MRRFILNIGLETNVGTKLETSEVLSKMTALGISWTAPQLVLSNTEPTLVVHLEGSSDAFNSWVHAAVALLSRELQQDCIAVWDVGAQRGKLIGPNASKWGPFNPAYFILGSGETLQARLDDELLQGLGL